MTEPEQNDAAAAEGGHSDREVNCDQAMDAMDAMVASARIQRGVVMDDTVALTEDQRREIRGRFARLLNNGDITYTQAAKGLGGDVTKGKLSQVVRGVYRDEGRGKQTVDRILRNLDKWLGHHESISNAPKLPGFATITVAREIRGIAQAVVDMQKMAAVWADAGVGKTSTLRWLLSVFPGSILVTINDGTNTVSSFLRELARSLELEVGHFRHENRYAILERLRNSGRLLLIVDEAHLADLRVLNCIRQLHDDCGISVLLAGQRGLQKRLDQGRQDDSIGAMLWSRVQIKRNLHERCEGGRGQAMYPMEDIHKLFGKSAVRMASSAMQWLAKVANSAKDGYLRTATTVHLSAQYIATRSPTPSPVITVELLEQANVLMNGRDRAYAISQRIKQTRKVA